MPYHVLGNFLLGDVSQRGWIHPHLGQPTRSICNQHNDLGRGGDCRNLCFGNS